MSSVIYIYNAKMILSITMLAGLLDKEDKSYSNLIKGNKGIVLALSILCSLQRFGMGEHDW